MKKNNKGTKNPTKVNTKPNKLEVIVDMTELSASEAILKSKKELGMVVEAVEEVKEDIVSEVAAGTKKVHWYNKLWNTIKSIF